MPRVGLVVTGSAFLMLAGGRAFSKKQTHVEPRQRRQTPVNLIRAAMPTINVN
jgi:hypothetical protein